MRSKSELQDGIIEKNYKHFLMMLNCANYNSISMEDVLGIFATRSINRNIKR